MGINSIHRLHKSRYHTIVSIVNPPKGAGILQEVDTRVIPFYCNNPVRLGPEIFLRLGES